jgi:hypothetical protein
MTHNKADQAKRKKSKSAKHTSTALKKAVPPADNPLLRHEAEQATHGDSAEDARQRALARARALHRTRQMPAAETTDDTPPEGER